MDKAIFGKETRGDMFEDIGLDSLTRNIKISELTEDIINNASLSLYNERIHILPGTMKENKNLFESDLLPAFPAIVNKINKFYDFVFINLAAGPDIISKKIIGEADLIVIILAQNINIDTCFSGYHFPREKTLYLIGKYNGSSRYNLKNLVRSYPELKNKTAVIPYNIGFSDAMTDGRVTQFMVKNLVNCKGDNNLYFFKEVNKAVELLVGGGNGQVNYGDI